MSFLKPRSRETRRDQIMTVAELAILEKGFAATTIEELIAEVGMTKGGFFYHFKDKSDLVKAILRRHLAVEELWFDALFSQARAERGPDPLDVYLGFLEILKSDMERLPDVHPGCLIAACCFQERLFEPEIHALARTNLLRWRERFHGELTRVARVHPAPDDIDLEALADMATALTDGGIILAKTVREKGALPRQIGLYARFVEMVFRPEARPVHHGPRAQVAESPMA